MTDDLLRKMEGAARGAAPDAELADLSERAVIVSYLRGIQGTLLDLKARIEQSHKSHYTVDEVATRIGRSPYTVRRYVADGIITAIRIPGAGPRGRLLVPHEELQRLIAAGRGGAIPDALGA